ncbi:hypothetical protein [Nostoc sp. FACHB-888]|uniref:hypothetical protein n=1 Tax=Nostoc sp. FACHB-888 TaxID=2692842 RepID=UPI001F549A26|nr:hypothetical protein [Nostoc sp. FACHB-888]
MGTNGSQNEIPDEMGTIGSQNEISDEMGTNGSQILPTSERQVRPLTNPVLSLSENNNRSKILKL